MSENNPRPDPRRHGGTLLDVQRCPGCRRLLDPATMQEWATPAGFATREEAIHLLVFYICNSCFDRTQTERGFVYANRIDATGRAWAEMDAALSAFRGETHADVL